jgi:hypothetical protein
VYTWVREARGKREERGWDERGESRQRTANIRQQRAVRRRQIAKDIMLRAGSRGQRAHVREQRGREQMADSRKQTAEGRGQMERGDNDR